jgi:MFS family permease
MIEFNVSREVAILPVSVFTLGLAIGPLIFAPMSEVFGRRILYILTFLLLVVFTAGASRAQNIETLIICRLLAGIFGSAPVAISAGMFVAWVHLRGWSRVFVNVLC